MSKSTKTYTSPKPSETKGYPALNPPKPSTGTPTSPPPKIVPTKK